MALYLGEGAVKDKKTSKINGGMFVTKLARSYGILDRGAARVLTMLPTSPFSINLFRRAKILEDFGGCNSTIPENDAVVPPKQPGKGLGLDTHVHMKTHR